MSSEDRHERRHRHVLKLLLVSLRTGFCIGLMLFGRILKQCEHRVADKGRIEEPEGMISTREGEGQGNGGRTVGR